jgi:hypothetical protein
MAQDIQRYIVCEFVCERAFIDEWHPFMHYNSGACVYMDGSTAPKKFYCPTILSPEKKRIGQDKKKIWRSYHFEGKGKGKKGHRTAITAMSHWAKFHGKDEAKRGAYFTCTTCKHGFSSEAMYVLHFQLPYGGIEAHTNVCAFALVDKGLAWNPSRRCTFIELNTITHPSYQELLNAHTLSSGKFHAIVAFRQSRLTLRYSKTTMPPRSESPFFFPSDTQKRKDSFYSQEMGMYGARGWKQAETQKAEAEAEI